MDARLPCPLPTSRARSNSCPLSWWCHPTILSSVIPFSSCLQSFPASEPFPMSQFFTSGGQSIGASTSAAVLPMNFQATSKGASPSSPVRTSPTPEPVCFSAFQGGDLSLGLLTAKHLAFGVSANYLPFWLALTCYPMGCSTISQSLLKFMSIESVMPSNHLFLCCPLLLLPSVFPSIRVFSSESDLCIRWPNYRSFSFSISSSNEHPGLTFRMDWLDLLAVQGTLKSLLQHHNSKAQTLLCQQRSV